MSVLPMDSSLMITPLESSLTAVSHRRGESQLHRSTPPPLSMAYYNYAIIGTSSYTSSTSCLTLHACSPTTTQTHIVRRVLTGARISISGIFGRESSAMNMIASGKVVQMALNVKYRAIYQNPVSNDPVDPKINSLDAR